jgi:HD domain
VHPIKGAEMFAVEPGLGEVAKAIRHHHERFDGTGYPDGLAGQAIPLFSRPPLREIRQDIPGLANYLLANYCREMKKDATEPGSRSCKRLHELSLASKRPRI